jgi:hypothetical protein
MAERAARKAERAARKAERAARKAERAARRRTHMVEHTARRRAREGSNNLSAESSDPPSEPSGIPPGGSRGDGPAGQERGCQVTVDADSPVFTAGEPQTIHGQLACHDATTVPDQSVTLYQRQAGKPGFSIAGTSTTEPNGSYRIALAAVDANSIFYARSDGVRSRHLRVSVIPQITFNGSFPDGAQLSIGGHRPGGAGGNAVSFTGIVSPADAGAVVALQIEDDATGERWHRIGLGDVSADGTYSITHAFGIPGEVHVRVVVRHHGNLACASESLSYAIAPRQNPRLTIRTSADRVPFGQPVTISGVLARAAGQPVTLLARAAGERFTQVARITTDGAGNYVFPLQTPLRSTFYRVIAADQTSAVLHESVSYTLTARSSATTAQVGETLTFSGTVTRARAGQPVYLERQDVSGLGFHRVGTGTVSANSTYAIAHPFFGTGATILRITVPGDAENVAESTKAMTIIVAPALPAALGLVVQNAPGLAQSPP